MAHNAQNAEVHREGPRWRAEGADEPRQERDRVSESEGKEPGPTPSADVTRLVIYTLKASFPMAVNWFGVLQSHIGSHEIPGPRIIGAGDCQHDGI